MKHPIRTPFFLVTLLALLLALVSPAYAAPVIPENVEKAEEASLLQLTSGGHILGFTSNGMYAANGSHALHVDFVNANHVTPQTNSVANEENKTAPLGRVNYPNLWDGISLAYTSDANGIYTTTYTLAVGADVKNIRLQYNRPISLNKDDSLTIAFENGTLTESAPIAWQEIDGQPVMVDVTFWVEGKEVGFSLGKYDLHYSVIIDPTLTWNTFLGGNNDDTISDIAVDANGNIYVSGTSMFSWGNPVRAYGGFYEGFVAKLNSSGVLVWNTFLGGGGADYVTSIVVDSDGNLYASGTSSSTWGSPIRTFASGGDAFAAKLDSSGNLIWNTFLGGSGGDSGKAITIDGTQNLYLAGSSNASWGSPIQAYTSGGLDAFVAKLNSSGSLTWHTFLGGNSHDDSFSIARDGEENIYIVGYSWATWGSPIQAYTAGYDGFAAKLNSNGTLIWNTFLGGNGTDQIGSLAIDSSNNIFISGSSNETWGNPIQAYTSGNDGFISKLNSSGSLIWNTFLGHGPISLALDSGGNIYVAGSSAASWGDPIREYTPDMDSFYLGDAFAAQLSPSGSLIWNTFLGGASQDMAGGIIVDGNGNIYVTGLSRATWENPIRGYTSGLDVFVTKLTPMFEDVPTDYWAFNLIERLFNAGITGGCTTSPLNYCPTSPVTRAQMAIFLEKGIHGSSFSPTDIPATFTDTVAHWAEDWIEALKQDGVTSGCGAGIYCPENPVTRAQMAVFLLKAKHGSSYSPPDVSATFGDTAGHWAEDWIEQLALEGITSGCGGGLYCPENTVTRDQMAVFLVKAFNLP